MDTPEYHSPMTDRLNKLYEIADGYRATFDDGDSPFVILARLTEELGEIATAVNHLERKGAKVDKHGEPDPSALAEELEDLLHNTLALARHYGVEGALDAAIDATHARVAPRRPRSTDMDRTQ
ncbi:hypothetical protein STSO111631_17280 [Stackebrandtia soli]